MKTTNCEIYLPEQNDDFINISVNGSAHDWRAKFQSANSK